ncbi:MAG: hypothetical protein HRF46_11265 [Acidobacteriota bacterium]|jgi:hypothetical protein
MRVTLSLLVLGSALAFGVAAFLAWAGRPLSRRVGAAIVMPALAALVVFAPWNADPRWQLAYTVLLLGAAAVMAVAGSRLLRADPALAVPFFVVPAVLGGGAALLAAEGSPLARAFWVGPQAPGPDLVFFSALAVAVIASRVGRKGAQRPAVRPGDG